MKFRMVDRIVAFEPGKNISGVKTVSFEEYQLKSVFTIQPSLPESLIMESFFQLGNWLIMLTSDFSQIGLLLRTSEVRFEQPLMPGRSMFMEVDVHSYRDDGILFDGKATVERQIIATGKGCLAIPVKLTDYYNPDDMRVLYSEIFIPQEK